MTSAKILLSCEVTANLQLNEAKDGKSTPGLPQRAIAFSVNA